MISGRSGSWVGSDHLFNLSNQIEVGSEIVKPESLTLSITNQEIDQTIRAAFSKAQITPEADVTKEGAPLPFFHVLVMVYPVKDQYVAYITGRLFESVTMKRAKFEGGVVFQGITWEDQNLMMASKENFPKEVQKNVDEIVNNFTGRYQYFEKIR